MAMSWYARARDGVVALVREALVKEAFVKQALLDVYWTLNNARVQRCKVQVCKITRSHGGDFKSSQQHLPRLTGVSFSFLAARRESDMLCMCVRERPLCTGENGVSHFYLPSIQPAGYRFKRISN